MANFTTDDGVRIHYTVFPETAANLSGVTPVILQHGFTGNHEVDFVENGLVDTLVAAGKVVVALDARGHGLSDAPHGRDRYGEERMAKDVSQLADHLGSTQFDLLGFSMGAVIALFVAANDRRVRRWALTGLGASAVEQGGLDRNALDVDAMADVLENAQSGAALDDTARDYLGYLGSRGLDRLAIASVARARHSTPDLPFARMTAPCLLLMGGSDPLATRPEVLAAALPDAKLSVLDGDHGSVLTNPAFAVQLLEFLAEG